MRCETMQSAKAPATPPRSALPAHGRPPDAPPPHHATPQEYDALYARSIAEPDAFWRELALENFHWQTPPNEKHIDYNFDVNQVRARSTPKP